MVEPEMNFFSKSERNIIYMWGLVFSVPGLVLSLPVVLFLFHVLDLV